jgi:hypothetical protein
MNKWLVATAIGLVGPIALVGCGGSGQARQAHDHGKCLLTKHFDLSLTSMTGGASSPITAAKAARIPEVSIPKTGWEIAGSGGGQAMVLSGGFALHAVQGADGTWQVDSGFYCAKY